MKKLIVVLFTLITLISQAGCPSITLTTTYTPILCSGGKSTITNTVVGGVAPYKYLYLTLGNNPKGKLDTLAYTNSNTIDVVAGYYRVRIVDAKGCTMETSFPNTKFSWYHIEDLSKPITISEVISNTSSINAKNGSITVTPIGGNSPYTYKWNDNSVNNSINNVISGTYSVIVTDKNKCTATKSIFLPYNTPSVTHKDNSIDSITPQLGQNYPNPITEPKNGNVFTTIEYVIPSYDEFYLRILSTDKGNIVYNEKLEAKKTKVMVECHDFKKGNYIYQLVQKSNNKVLFTKKMIIQ